MIEAIIWDFGGVITTSPFEAFNLYENENGVPLNFIRMINATNPDSNAWAQFESNQIRLDEFDTLFASESKAAGCKVSGKDVIGLLYGEVRPRMIEVLKECKKHYKVACITNNVAPNDSADASIDGAHTSGVAEALALFDLVVESSIEGIRKPDPRIYTNTCERLGVAPENAVFLDDLGINLKPARALGMQTIKVVSEAQAISELASITGLEFK